MMRSVGNGLTDGVIWRQLVGCPFPPSSPLPSTALLARPLIQAHCTPKPNFNAQPGSSASSSVPIQAPPPMPEWSLLGRHSCPRIRSLVVPDHQSPLALVQLPLPDLMPNVNHPLLSSSHQNRLQAAYLPFCLPVCTASLRNFKA